MANATITLLTIGHWSFATAGFPIYILVLTTILYALVRHSAHNGGRCERSSSSARESPSS